MPHSFIITVLSELHTDFSLLKFKSFTLFICGKTSNPLVETPKIVVVFHLIKKKQTILIKLNYEL